jgi:hypothetical protein
VRQPHEVIHFVSRETEGYPCSLRGKGIPRFLCQLIVPSVATLRLVYQYPYFAGQIGRINEMCGAYIGLPGGRELAV